MPPSKNVHLFSRQFVRKHVIFITLLLIYILWETDFLEDAAVYSSRANGELGAILQTKLVFRNISRDKTITKVKTSQEKHRVLIEDAKNGTVMSSERKREGHQNTHMSNLSVGRDGNTSETIPGLKIPPEVSSALGKRNMSLCHVKGVLELVRTVDPRSDPGDSPGGSRIVNRYSPGRIWPAAVHDRLKLYRSHCTGPLPADLILVMHSGTNARSAMRRARARNTWLQTIKQLEFRVLVVFTVALSNNQTVNDEVRQEAETSDDMLIFDFADSFRNLTLKTMSTFEWIAQNCSNARFILKTDEDTFVNFTNILHFLPSASRSFGVVGSCYGLYDSKVFRDLKFKFGVPMEQYPFPYFGPYCSGRGYLMSAGTLQLIVRASAFIPIIDMEDAYVGKCNQCLGMYTMSTHYFACQYKKNDRILRRCVVIHDMNWGELNATVT